jgi:hypothetical protein
MSRLASLSSLSIIIAASACLDDGAAVQSHGGDIAVSPSCSPDDDPCIPGELLDTSPAPGVQPECAVSAFLRDDDDSLEYIVPPCKITGGEPPCFQLILDRDVCPETPSGLRIDLRHDWGDDLIDLDVECVHRRAPRR